MNNFSDLSKKEVADKIKEWLKEEGLEPKDFEGKNDDTAINFFFKQQSIKIHVGFLKSSKDCLIMGGKIELDSKQEKMFRYLRIKRQLIYDLELIFLQMNLDFVINPTNGFEKEDYAMTDIIIQKLIYFDGLSKDKFFDTRATIFNCLKIIMMKFNLLIESK